jgi:hypothetical protein
VPHEKWGELCTAFVVLLDGPTATAEESPLCKGKIAGYKVPRTSSSSKMKSVEIGHRKIHHNCCGKVRHVEGPYVDAVKGESER